LSFSLTILGSNSALPTHKKFSSAHLLNVNEHFFLFDCSEGTQIRMRQHKAKLGRLNHVFISHLHGDHFFGLFGLLSSLNLLGRKHPLHVFADSMLKNMIRQVTSVYENQQGYELVFHDLNKETPEIILDTDHFCVQSLPLRHRIPAWGFLFREKQKPRNILKAKIREYNIPVKEILKIKDGADFKTPSGEIIGNKTLTLPPYKPRSYAYLTDTICTEKHNQLIEGVDLLYHEATFLHKDVKKARDTMHSTALQAAKLASNASAGKLLLGHVSERYKNPKEFENEARSVFPESYMVNDGDRFTIKQTRDKEK
jgi:ribonuclease Z